MVFGEGGVFRAPCVLAVSARVSFYRCILASLFLALFGSLSAIGQDEIQTGETQGPSEQSLPTVKLSATTGVLPAKGPLIVPVFPRGSKTGDAPVSTDLRDSYILLEDGSALSVADWILGSLNKDKAGAAMSDYENRLFLGQVARAMVGMDEDLVHHSFVNVRPTVKFAPPPPPGAAMQALQGVVNLVGGAIFSGTPEGWHPAKTGGAFSQLQHSGGDAAILFEEQFSGAMLHSVQDIRDTGTFQNMLDEQKAKLEKKAND